MQFSLPSNLQQELLAYDPALKKLAQENKQAKPKTKPKYPLGNVNDLIPFHIVSASKQQHAIDYINSHNVENRIYKFTKFVNIEVDGVKATEEVVHAFIYHFESLWVAVWLPNPDDNYIYGYAHAYKNTATAANMVSMWRANLHTEDNHSYVKYGRSEFHVCRQNVTFDYIKTMRSERLWSVSQSWGKGTNIATVAMRFEQQLRKVIPIWTDSTNMFDRIKCKSIANALTTSSNDIELMDAELSDWVPTFDTIAHIINNIDDRSYAYTSANIDGYRGTKNVLSVIDTPFMRRWIQARLDESITAYNDPANDKQSNILHPWNQIRHLIRHISYVQRIWPNCPLDYYQNHLQIMLQVDPYHVVSGEGQLGQWLQQHMPVASYFKIISKFYYQQLDEMVQQSYRREHMRSGSTGMFMFRMYEWRDTLQMLDNLLTHGKTVEPPKRWRITEFHDTLQAESWKIKHPNAALPQDLFPEPIRVEVDDIRWSFFQPTDTHQLASWGQAVRNCVGNVSDYANGVRKKKHFIVLCMLDGKPQFTVQLDVNHGVMNVKQIAGISNARLTEDQREQYTEAFRLALQERDRQLESA
jgi:hypothetical protein